VLTVGFFFVQVASDPAIDSCSGLPIVSGINTSMKAAIIENIPNITDGSHITDLCKLFLWWKCFNSVVPVMPKYKVLEHLQVHHRVNQYQAQLFLPTLEITQLYKYKRPRKTLKLYTCHRKTTKPNKPEIKNLALKAIANEAVSTITSHLFSTSVTLTKLLSLTTLSKSSQSLSRTKSAAI